MSLIRITDATTGDQIALCPTSEVAATLREHFAEAPQEVRDTADRWPESGVAEYLDVRAVPVDAADLDDEEWGRVVWAAVLAGGSYLEGAVTVTLPEGGLSRVNPAWTGAPLVAVAVGRGEPAVGRPESWGEVRRMVQDAHVRHWAAELDRASARRRAAESAAEAARREHYWVMREAMASGLSAYRVAQLVGMTQRAVHKIRDGATG